MGRSRHPATPQSDASEQYQFTITPTHLHERDALDIDRTMTTPDQSNLKLVQLNLCLVEARVSRT